MIMGVYRIDFNLQKIPGGVDASEVLNFFKDLGPVSGKFLDVLSISTVEDRGQTDTKEKSAVDLYLTSKDERGVWQRLHHDA